MTFREDAAECHHEGESVCRGGLTERPKVTLRRLRTELVVEPIVEEPLER